jgi:hypothetical protein
MPQRLADILDLLKEQGTYVVVHLGSTVDELTLTAMRRAEMIWAASADEELDEYEALLEAMTAEGIAHEQILWAQSEDAVARPAGRRAKSRPGRVEWEPATARLAPV